jgi:hypothetical protein
VALFVAEIVSKRQLGAARRAAAVSSVQLATRFFVSSAEAGTKRAALAGNDKETQACLI